MYILNIFIFNTCIHILGIKGAYMLPIYCSLCPCGSMHVYIEHSRHYTVTSQRLHNTH